MYRYFGSKREILDHVVDFGIEKVMDTARIAELVGTASSVEDLVDCVRAAVERLFALLEREPRLLRLLLVEAGAIDPELAQRLLGLEGIAAAVVAGELARGIQQGWIRPDIDPEVLGHTILTLVGPGLLRELLGGGNPEARIRNTAAVLRVLGKALSTRQAS